LSESTASNRDIAVDLALPLSLAPGLAIFGEPFGSSQGDVIVDMICLSCSSAPFAAIVALAIVGVAVTDAAVVITPGGAPGANNSWILAW